MPFIPLYHLIGEVRLDEAAEDGRRALEERSKGHTSTAFCPLTTTWALPPPRDDAWSICISANCEGSTSAI